MFHSGDSDSTGVIAAACYGAMYGFKDVPENLYKVRKDFITQISCHFSCHYLDSVHVLYYSQRQPGKVQPNKYRT